MTTDYHAVFPTNVAADSAQVESRLASLDAGIGDAMSFGVNNNAELVAARGPYPSVAARFEALVMSGGNVAEKANGVSAAGQKVLTVDGTTGFIVGAYVTYLLNGTTLEGNTIASINDGVSLVLGTNIGATPAGGVLDDTYISMISISEYLAAQAIPHAGTLMLPQTMEYVNAGRFNIKAYGASPAASGAVNSAAIQAAIDAAYVAGSTEVVADAGSYAIASTITVPRGVILRGAAASMTQNGTVFTSNAGSTPCIQIGDGGGTAGNNAGIKNLAVVAGTGSAGTGIYIYGVFGAHLSNVAVVGFTTGTGVKIAGGTANIATIQTYTDRLYLENNLVNLHLTGIDTESDNSSADEGVFVGTRIQMASLVNSKGIYIEKGMGNRFFGTTVGDSSVVSGTVGLKIDHGARTLWASRYNHFHSLVIGTCSTGIQFTSKAYFNYVYGFIGDFNTTALVDASGGGNIIYHSAGKENSNNPVNVAVAQNYGNMLKNAMLERWENAGLGYAPTGWGLLGASATIAREATIKLYGSYSAKVARVGSDVSFIQTVYEAGLAGRWVSAGVWVKTDTASSVCLRATDDTTFTNSPYHTGDGTWQYLSVRYHLGAAATYLNVLVSIATTNCTAYLDSFVLVEGIECPLPIADSVPDAQRLTNTATWDPADTADGAITSTTIAITGAAVGDCVSCGFSVAVPAGALLVGAITATDVATVTLFNHTGGNLNLGSGTLTVDVWTHR